MEDEDLEIGKSELVNHQATNIIIPDEEDKDRKKERKGSLVHPLIIKNKVVFVSLDLEHGGYRCGIT